MTAESWQDWLRKLREEDDDEEDESEMMEEVGKPPEIQPIEIQVPQETPQDIVMREYTEALKAQARQIFQEMIDQLRKEMQQQMMMQQQMAQRQPQPQQQAQPQPQTQTFTIHRTQPAVIQSGMITTISSGMTATIATTSGMTFNVVWRTGTSTTVSPSVTTGTVNVPVSPAPTKPKPRKNIIACPTCGQMYVHDPNCPTILAKNKPQRHCSVCGTPIKTYRNKPNSDKCYLCKRGWSPRPDSPKAMAERKSKANGASQSGEGNG